MNMRMGGFILGIPFGAIFTAIIGFLTMPPALDEPILNALKTLGSPLPYVQNVETTVDIGDRRLVIRGRYFVDHDRRIYDSAATTTLSLRGGEDIGTFMIANRVIGDDVYTRVITETEGLMTAVPTSGEWHRFRRGAIPQEFIDISSDRPILDNLVLLRGEGAYLTLEKKFGVSMFDGSEELLRYGFRLSPQALEIRGGTMGALVGRLGTAGNIELWLTRAGELRHITLSAPAYAATTTITDVNNALIIEAP